MAGKRSLLSGGWSNEVREKLSFKELPVSVTRIAGLFEDFQERNCQGSEFGKS